MSQQTAYSTGESSQKITRKLTLANLAVMTVLLALSLIALNVFTTISTYQRIDAEQERNLGGFTQSHLSSEKHSQRLPSGLLPTIYFKDADSGFINPHPSDLVRTEAAEFILAQNLPQAHTDRSLHDRTYRIYRVVYEVPLEFWESEQSYTVSETVSIRDITSEAAGFSSMRGASIICFALSVIVFGIFAYRQARNTIVPINEAWEKQRRFTADTSHELRNPLAVIQTNAELLLQNPSATVEEQSAHVSAILDGSNRMASMLTTLLTLARADADQVEIQKTTVDLSALAFNLQESFTQIGALRGIAVSGSIEPGCSVAGDGGRLRELLSILIDNAIRYTEPGGTVDIDLKSERESIVARIEDTGIGMSRDELSSVFQRFYRSDRAYSINPEGTGLGLPIAQWIAERHGAEFRIESEKGKGTSIILVFKHAG